MRKWIVGAMMLAMAGCAGAKTPPPLVTQVVPETLKVEERDPMPTGFTAVVVVSLDNLGGADVTAKKAVYEVVTDGNVVESGEVEVTATLPAGQMTRAEILVPVKYASVARAAKSYTFAVRGQLFLSDGVVDFAKAGAVRAPVPPKLDVASMRLEGSDRTGLTAAADISVENTNTFNFPIRQITWKLTVDGKLFGEGNMAVGSIVKAATTTGYQFSLFREPGELKERGIKFSSSFSYELELLLEGEEGTQVPLKKADTVQVLRG